ncbi:beta-ketoacyl synthase [Aurantibacter crassamenti]|uniref:beta-ketoacyl synthase N-terminal-like domain-containing protein n=1 Tax=Aurantibacter crassamenti TaxID=1837375 RepID=UPI001939997F|nr:beta-ketoacyl synthase N-terminal-like domain-containing protein [Aurantibacter crassamenti]MBM1104858.1 beta-ketoacyl synthase [Aurantibacter crassamenti]
MKEPIYITSLGSISALGCSSDEVWKAYQNHEHRFIKKEFNGSIEWMAPLNESSNKEIELLRKSDIKYKNLDDTVLFAIFAARSAASQAGWKAESNFGINIGSSRGATSLFEKYHQEFLENSKTSTLSSPTTTLGNISSWVAHDLQSTGPEISHSITCSTALHALLNGIAWISGGMADKFLVGGSEAPLTPFTIAQMKALKIYSREVDDFPCKALNLTKKYNSMILGEGAAIVCLEKGKPENALATIEGVGYATEILEHNISISTDAKCFQRSMRMALGDCAPDEIDVIVTHTPGTIKGDLAEFKAINEIFKKDIPYLTNNKWKLGHTFGASGMLSVEMALLMLQHQEVIKVPYLDASNTPGKIKKVMVNAVGFGGNAVSVVLSS